MQTLKLWAEWEVRGKDTILCPIDVDPSWTSIFYSHSFMTFISDCIFWPLTLTGSSMPPFLPQRREVNRAPCHQLSWSNLWEDCRRPPLKPIRQQRLGAN